MNYLIGNFKRSKKSKAYIANRRLRGFNLIELLVVISVLALLSAILIPIVNAVRDSARTTKSLSNLRQMASAMQMYSSDNNGLYPIGYFNPAPEDSDGNSIPSPYGNNLPFDDENYWYLEIAQYLDQRTVSNTELNNILISPFVDEELAEGFFAGGEARTTPSTYSVHGVICPDITNEDSRFPMWSIEENHSEIILVAEGTLMDSGYSKAVLENPAQWYILEDNPTPAFLESKVPIIDEAISGAISYRANDHALVAFLDCHVEALEKGAVKYKNIVISR